MILCLLEIVRVGVNYGIEFLKFVKLEKEIDDEIVVEEEKKMELKLIRKEKKVLKVVSIDVEVSSWYFILKILFNWWECSFIFDIVILR